MTPKNKRWESESVITCILFLAICSPIFVVMHPALSPPSNCPIANPGGIWVLPGDLWSPLAWLSDVYLTQGQAYFLLALLFLSPLTGWWTTAIVWKKKIKNGLYPVLYILVPVLLGCLLPGVWITNIFRVLLVLFAVLFVLLGCLVTLRTMKDKRVVAAVVVGLPACFSLFVIFSPIHALIFGDWTICPDADGCPEILFIKWGKEGTTTFPDGTKYVGVYRDKPGGFKGTLTYPDGKKFIGNFDFSKDESKWESVIDSTGRMSVETYHKHKPWNGTEYDRDGNVSATYWKGVPPWECVSDWSCHIAELMHGLKDGHGAVTKPDGSTYVGE